MRKLLERLLIFVVGLPLVIVLIVFLPYKNHLAVNIAVMILSAMGALELAQFFKIKNAPLSSVETVVLGLLGPLAQMLVISFKVNSALIPAAMIAGVSWLLISRIFSPPKQIDTIAGTFSAGITVMLYPGCFMLWITRMAAFSYASSIILVFTLIVVINDSAAWACGTLFGASNRGIIAISPSKSVAGFVGGLTASVIIGAGAAFFIPISFTSNHLQPVLAGGILGLFSGIAATLGDLGESALKRSIPIKDSGTIIPGRGGVLDSIDSLALAAPVYYALYRLLFG
jgi:phosphatidate cytidylyltransferase